MSILRGEYGVDSLIYYIDFFGVDVVVGYQVGFCAFADSYHPCGNAGRAAVLEVVEPSVYRAVVSLDAPVDEVVDSDYGRAYTLDSEGQFVAESVIDAYFVVSQLQGHVDSAPPRAHQRHAQLRYE